MRYTETSFSKKSKFHTVCTIFFLQDGDITVEDILTECEKNASLFWLAPGAHAMGCPGVSEGTTLMKLRAERPSVRTVLPTQPSPQLLPRICISKNLELQLRGAQCGLGGRPRALRSNGEVAVRPSTVMLLLGTSATSSLEARTLFARYHMVYGFQWDFVRFCG